MRISIKELRRRGYSQSDIEDALRHQEAQRRVGAPVLPLLAILSGETPQLPLRGSGVVVTNLTARQLRRRGSYGQAALLLDQAALREQDPSRADKARKLAWGAKELARPEQFEFDFWRGGNMVMADQYHDAIRSRLMATKATPSERARALAVLQEIKRWLGWQDFTCTKSAAEIGELLEFNKVDMSDTLALLEEIGAITRIKRGRTKVITVTPEGAFRGDLNRHSETMERYKAEVVPLRTRLDKAIPEHAPIRKLAKVIREAGDEGKPEPA